ncbi:MAG TPA: hypothetical protein V6D17_14155 [Candidatus Obscuribacterales bacterium]
MGREFDEGGDNAAGRFPASSTVAFEGYNTTGQSLATADRSLVNEGVLPAGNDLLQALQDAQSSSLDLQGKPVNDASNTINLGGKVYDATNVVAEAQPGTDQSQKKTAGPGEYVTVHTEHGKLNIPEGNPAFGLPTNFEAYSKNVNEYVKWMERWNSNYYGWRDMDGKQREDFANALRHSLGVGYLVFQGMPPEMAVNKALEHEVGDASLDSRQDRHNNIWGAQTADKMAKEGKTWYDFVANATYSAAQAAFHNKGFLK